MAVYFIVPCGAGKQATAAPARELYTGSAFKHALAAAEAEAAATEHEMGVETEVLILSALHGLVALETVLEPYEQKMGQPGSIGAEALAATAVAHGIGYGSEVYAMLPKAYYEALAAALAPSAVWVQSVYEAAPGIGYQRAVGSSLMRSAERSLV